MAATISVEPPEIAFNQNPIWVTVHTDQVNASASSIVITVSGSPTVGQTFKITWPGGTVTFTAAATTSTDGLSWPIQTGGETLEDYTTRLAEFLRECADLRDIFTISKGSTTITLLHPVAGIFPIAVLETLSGISATVTSVTTAPTPDGLAALVETWSDTGSFNSNRLLDVQQSPYVIESSKTVVDIQGAFAHLKPYLPGAATINPATPALSNPVATTHLQKYYLRVADRFGIPPRGGALTKTTNTYLAILGGRAGDARSTDWPPLRHNYRRRDHLEFIKPVDMAQPDWVYFLPDADAAADILITIHWSDGTDSNYSPFGVADTPWIADRIYVVPSGFMQMNLHTVTPTGGTDADATIIGYDWVLESDADWTVTVKYEVRCDTPWEHYLLFSNGMGGMETVGLRGKMLESYTASNETYAKPRLPTSTIVDGDMATYAGSGQAAFDFSTGWYDDPFYLEHLKQLPLAGGAWLVDVVNRRFLPVIIEGQTLETNQDDETLFSVNLKVKSGWLDQNFNV